MINWDPSHEDKFVTKARDQGLSLGEESRVPGNDVGIGIALEIQALT